MIASVLPTSQSATQTQVPEISDEDSYQNNVSSRSTRYFADESCASRYGRIPTAEDKKLAQTVTAPMIERLAIPGLRAPVVRESLLDSHFRCVLPFFARSRFVPPFALASKAPFASVEPFRFVRVAGATDSLVYANNTDQLYVTVKRQARALYSPGLGRHVLRSGSANTGLVFLAKVYIVGATLEVMQCWCNQAPHLQWRRLPIGAHRTKNGASGVAMPVLNPSHRNVLDGAQADLLLSADELESVLRGSKNPLLQKADAVNAKYLEYGGQCLDQILSQRIKAQDPNDFTVMQEHLDALRIEYQDRLGSPSLGDPAPNDAFAPAKEASLCQYPTTERTSEPAASVNAFLEWDSVTDFAVKHCNAAQLFQQQLLRNPLLMHQQPQRAFVSLTGPVQMDACFFLGHTNMFVGAYEKPVREKPHKPKVAELTAAVALHAIAVIPSASIDSRLTPTKARLENEDLTTKQRLEIYGQLWSHLPKLLGDTLQAFADRLAEVAAHKLDFFKRCRPLIYTQFRVDGKCQGFFTNVQFDYAGGEPQFRPLSSSKRDKALFTRARFDEALRSRQEPVLVDVAALADEDPEALTMLNWEGLFKPLGGIPPQYADDDYIEQPWYPLYRLYLDSQKEPAPAKTVELVDITLLVQAQRPLAKHALLAEHQLCNMGASDFGSHCAVPDAQAATFLAWVYTSLLMTRQLTVGRQHLESYKRVTQLHVSSIPRWFSDRHDQLGSRALADLKSLLLPKELEQYTEFTLCLADRIRANPSVGLAQAATHEAFKLLAQQKPEQRFTIL